MHFISHVFRFPEHVVIRINQSIHFIPEYSIHIQIMLSHGYAIKKTKLTSMHVHIAYASNAGAIGTCIGDHSQQCSARLYCMTSL